MTHRRCIFYSQTPHPSLPSKGGQYILAFGKQAVHLRNPYRGGSEPPPYGKEASPRHLRKDLHTGGARRCALRNSTNLKSSLSVDFRSFVCAPAVERNSLSVTPMCHPEQAKRVEPQAKRRGGCRVSGRRDLSWSCGCFLLRSYLRGTRSIPLSGFDYGRTALRSG